MEGDLTRLDSVPAASEVPPLRQPVYIGRRIYHLILLPRYHRMLGNLASLWRWLRAQNWRQWWERAALFWRWIVKVVLNLVACLSFLVIVALLYEIVTRQSIVIEPISVPQVLASNGYTPDVAARRLRDALQRYHEQAKTKMPSGLALHSEQPNFVVPTVGLSSEAITTFIRTFFGSTRERNISGEFTIVEHQLRLRLRTSGAEFYTSADGASPENPDRLLETAAPNIFDVTEPYVVAAMQYGVDPETGFKKAEEIVARWPSSNQNVVWSYILMGEFFRDRSDHDSAIMRYNEAINHNPKVAVAFNNRGLAYRGKRDWGSSRTGASGHAGRLAGRESRPTCAISSAR